VKSIVPSGAVVGALALLGGFGAAEVALDTRSSPASSLPWPRSSLSNAFLIPSSGGGAQAPDFVFALKPAVKAHTIAPSNRLYRASPPRSIPPGVYTTAPYSCIVVVPGPHPDDRCIVGPGGGDSSMPIIKPDLRFIPLHPRKK
jgi:hypothetical protein